MLLRCCRAGCVKITLTVSAVDIGIVISSCCRAVWLIGDRINKCVSQVGGPTEIPINLIGDCDPNLNEKGSGQKCRHGVGPTAVERQNLNFSRQETLFCRLGVCSEGITGFKELNEQKGV